MSQMNWTKNILMNLDLNPGQLVRFGTGLGGLLHCVGFPLGVTLSAFESCDGDRGSLAVA